MPVVPTRTLNNGLTVPSFALGTYLSAKNEVKQAVLDAIDAGYRHFDTAFAYFNEGEVASAINEKIAEGVVKREDIYFTTKLWSHMHKPEHVERIVRKTLADTGLGYFDLYLIHFPLSYVYHKDEELLPKRPDGKFDVDNSIDIVDTWRELEKLVKLGLVRSIGLSNFNSEQIKRIVNAAEIKPVINQVELSPTLNQKELRELCKEHGIILSDYCPLGRPDLAKKTPTFLFDDKVKVIADKYKKTPVQVALRYLYQLGTIPIPKSVTKSRIIENIDIFDFELTEDEQAVIDGFHTGERLVWFPEGKDSKEYPFSIPY